MQGRIYLTSTDLNDHHALAWQGTEAFSGFELIRRLVTSRLSPEHAALFALPLPDDVHRKADWYFLPPEEPGQAQNTAEQAQFMPGGQAVRLVDLPPQAQAPVRERLYQLGNAVYNLSRTLKSSQDSNQHTAGVLLEMALTFPGEEFIYTVNGFPVLTAWGFSSGTGAAGPEMLTRLRQAPLIAGGAAAAASISAPAPAGSGEAEALSAPLSSQEERIHKFALPWALLAFLLGALLVALLLYFLSPGFGLPAFSLLPGGCSRTPTPVVQSQPDNGQPSPELLQAQMLEGSLRSELELLQNELEMRLAQCFSEPLPEPVLQLPLQNSTPAPEADIPPLPELALPELPDFDEVPEEYPENPGDMPEVSEPPTEEAQNLEIPENPDNMQFLNGCWDAPTGLMNIDTRQPVIVEYCFENNGQGKIRITELDKNGKPMFNCDGPARARLEDDRLVIEDGGAVCPNGNGYHSNQVLCYKDRNGNTVCTGRSRGGSGHKWGPVPFRENPR
ncbi:MAG: hypothetical protein IJD04_05815 [Desulfovibrionaceae bacterium]|nr:hypothetical protein [Desulfovibrionaceae bacterium]